MNEISPIVDFDDKAHDPFALDQAVYGDIEDLYTPLAKKLAEGPVHKGGISAFVSNRGMDPRFAEAQIYTILGYEAVTAASNDADTFSIDVYKNSLGLTMGQTLSLFNPPEHTAIRKVIQKAFLPNVVAKWGESVVEPVVNALIDKFIDRGEADLVAEFVQRYPFQIIYKQLALPERDITTFHKLALSMTQVYGPYLQYGMEASRKLGAYFSEMIAERRKKPGDDLVSHLVQTELDGKRIPDEIIISFFRQLINAAGDTTYRGTGSLFIALLRNPDQLEQVRADRRLVLQAIEEALRWEGPIVAHMRSTTRDVNFYGTDIPKGALIYISGWAANHDSTVFPDPMKFDIHRKRERHFAFGGGHHLCLGQHLARVEMTRAMNSIFDRLPNVRLNPNKPQPRITGWSMRSPHDINVLFDKK